MNSQLNEDLKAAIEWQFSLQEQQLKQMAEFHQTNSWAAGVGEGHRKALENVNLKLTALQKMKENPSLMSDSLRSSILKAYQDTLAQTFEKQKAQKEAAEKYQKEQDAKIQQTILAMNNGDFKIQQGKIPHRVYVRDVNC